MSLPSKKDYPDYYKFISEPIDLTMIENKIKTNMVSLDLSQVSNKTCNVIFLSAVPQPGGPGG